MQCPYCGEQVCFLKSSEEVYGKDYGPLYACLPCKAWVGCHPNTTKPLGILANSELRHRKRMAHYYFDRLWKRKMYKEKCTKGRARRKGYKWLSEQLSVPKELCHIGMFDVETCKRVEELCKQF